jgi:hypothetical protein
MLVRLENSVQALASTVRLRGETYLASRNDYESQKRSYFESYYREQRTREHASRRFYSNQNVLLGLTAVDELPGHLLVTLQVFGKDRDVSAEDNPADSIQLHDSRGKKLGKPQEVTYDRLPSVNGLIVSLAYRWLADKGQRPAVLVIDRQVFMNQELISLVLPDPHHEAAFFGKALLDDTSLTLKDTEPEEQPPTRELIIPCQRIGNHLKVPMTVDIHGVVVNTAMILDTGASVTVLPKAVYDRGLSKPLDGLPTVQLQTANGMMTCPVDRLSLTTAGYTKTIPVALTAGGMSLLGADYFAGHSMTLDLERQCIVLNPAR